MDYESIASLITVAIPSIDSEKITLNLDNIEIDGMPQENTDTIITLS